MECAYPYRRPLHQNLWVHFGSGSFPSASIQTPDKSAGASLSRRFAEAVRGSAEMFYSSWTEADLATDDAAPLRVAQVGGTLPLPPRLMSAFLASSSRGQNVPPSPPGLTAERVDRAPPAERAGLVVHTKSATEEIPLLAGYNLISIPEEPADSDPASVFAAIAGQLGRVEARHRDCPHLR